MTVGTTADNAVTLSRTAYVEKAATNGYHSSAVEVQTYGNNDRKGYVYDSRGRALRDGIPLSRHTP